MTTPLAPPTAETSVLLDTDVFSHLMRHDARTERLRALIAGRTCLLTPFSRAELLAGATMANWGEQRLAALDTAMSRVIVLAMSDEVVRSYANVTSDAKRLGHPLFGSTQAHDRWIAAMAIAYGVPLLTLNARHFEGLPGLAILGDDWPGRD